MKIVDDDTRGVTVTPVQLELDEGGSRGYTVEARFAADRPGHGDAHENGRRRHQLRAGLAHLSYDTDWQTAQTVAVSAAEDGDPLDDQATIVPRGVRGGLWLRAMCALRPCR